MSKSKLILWMSCLLVLVSVYAQAGKPTYLPGFQISPYWNEQIKEFTFNEDVNILINAPAPESFDPKKPVRLIYYFLPNGNTIQQTIGRDTAPGEDWHFVIQHIGAQTRRLREEMKNENIVVAYMEGGKRSWPTWGGNHMSDYSTLIPQVLDAVKNQFKDYKTTVVITSHSGGGSFLLKYIQSQPAIPNSVERFVFLDSIYNYNEESKHGEKLLAWLKQDKKHQLTVISYDDRNVVLNGKPIVSPTGGTYYRSSRLIEYLGKYTPFTVTTTTDFYRYQALKGQVDIILHLNPKLKILHTVLVGEKNGYIHGVTSGTKYENKVAVFGGPVNYQKWIQPAIDASKTSLKVPAVFGDHMVLQHNQRIPVWGWSNAGDNVQVQFRKQTVTAVADTTGYWIANLSPEPAGGPETLIIGSDKINKSVFTDVYVGEVWVASGQSNMDMPLALWGKVQNYEQEIKNARYPAIRFLPVDYVISPVPLKDVSTPGWQVCSPEKASYFTAVGYFFARELYKKYHVPVGIIRSAWGGTKIQAWTSLDGIQNIPALEERYEKMEKTPKNMKAAQEGYAQKTAAWNQSLIKMDAGYSDGNYLWAKNDIDEASWKTITLPMLWDNAEKAPADLHQLNGVVWFRRTINLPDAWEGKDIKIQLGTIDDQDITFFNGTEIGTMTMWDQNREYIIPGKLVKKGGNQVTIRNLDTGGNGGFNSKPEDFRVSLNQAAKSQPQTISLAGDWKYALGFDLKNAPPSPVFPLFPAWPSCLYNSMIAPVIPYAIRGAIWYQGESDSGEAYLYRSSFPNMIHDWRQQSKQGDFPFLYVQLANWQTRSPQPEESQWAELREAQSMTLSVPNTGMITAIDIGDAIDIHPKNKQEVGRRLALVARNKVYGENIPATGPTYTSMKIDGDMIRIRFDVNGKKLVIKGSQSLKGFQIAGADHHFYWATAAIIGNEVLVFSRQVPQPVAVRYAWGNNPECNLYNDAGLPALPFRTDDWKGLTQ